MLGTVNEWRRCINAAKNGAGFLVADTETEGVKPYLGDRLVGVGAFVPGTTEPRYFSFRHPGTKNLPEKELLRIEEVLGDKNCYWINQNLKFDAHEFEMDGVAAKCKLYDTMLGMHLADENELSFKLEELGARYVDPKAKEAEAEMMEAIGGDKGNIAKSPASLVSKYACNDVSLAWGLFNVALDRLKKQGLTRIWDEISEYQHATIAMEREGALIDTSKLFKWAAEAKPEQEAFLAELREKYSWPTFNPNSHIQVKMLLDMKASDSSESEVLKSMGGEKALDILKYRHYTKLIGSFLTPFANFLCPDDRIRPDLRMNGTISGRYSCSEPNMQALPKDEDLFGVRSLVIAPDGEFVYSFDLSQIELRLLAHYTKDPYLLHAFCEEGADIHQMTAALLNIDRYWAKRINYGLVYGLGAPGLAKQLHIREADAKPILSRFHGQVPGIRKLYRKCMRIADANGYIPMWTGRRRHYNMSTYTHKAMSNLIQGGVAEIMRVIITNLYKLQQQFNARMFLQVHDEILFYAPEEAAEEFIPAVLKTMTDFDFAVPVLAEAKYGKSWGEAKAYESR